MQARSHRDLGQSELARGIRRRSRAALGDRHDSHEAEGASDLRAHLATIRESWRVVIAIIASALLLALAIAALKSPIYESTGLVQAEDKQKGIPGLEDLSSIVATANLAETEMELLRSRVLLGKVVDQLSLDVVAEPKFLPLLGKPYARWVRSAGPAEAPLGMNSYSWGGEKIAVTTFELPEAWLGEELTLVATSANTYEVYSPQKWSTTPRLVASGRPGELSSPHPDAPESVRLLVDEMIARPGTRFSIKRDHRLTAIENLQETLSISEKGKKTGVIQLGLRGERPKQIADIINSAEAAYVRQNIERKSAEAQQRLEFIESQLPEVKAKLEASEKALNDYRTRTASVDISIEAHAALAASGEVEKELMLTKLQLDDARAHFQDEHPATQTLKEKVSSLERQRSRLDGRFRTLPANELERTRLLRDVSVANELYVLLLNKAQELKVVKSGTIGSVRVVDVASIPVKPVSPKLSVVLPIALVIGTFLAVSAAFARRALSVGIDDPGALETLVGLPVSATIPHSRIETNRSKRRRSTVESPILAATNPDEVAVEAIRSLRTELQLALTLTDSNVVAISGPRPGIGKSFVAVNLAHLVANSGKRALLIDTDLRRGRLHEHFGETGRATGLAEVLAGKTSGAQVVQRTKTANLDFMSTGAVPPNPSELLGSTEYKTLIDWASAAYDIVILDTSPILAVTDAALAAQPAGLTYLVLRAGKHPLKEIAAAIGKFEQGDVRVTGLILNDIQPRAGYTYSRYGYSYQYAYKELDK